MRSPWETPEQAQTRLQQFAKERLEIAQALNAGSGSAGGEPLLVALEIFGELLHAEVDGTSPSHEGFQVWEWHCYFAFQGCAGNSVRQHKALEVTISPQRMDQAVGVARQWFLYTFGAEALEAATAERQPKPKVKSKIKFGEPGGGPE